MFRSAENAGNVEVLGNVGNAGNEDPKPLLLSGEAFLSVRRFLS